MDKESLRAGDAWEDVVIRQLSFSQHLIVIWSSKAKDSDWVTRERAFFDFAINGVAEKTAKDRRIIFVLLDDTPSAFNRYQMIKDIKDSNGYMANPNALDVGLWTSVCDQIEAAIEREDTSISVSLAILALTQDRFNDLYGKNTCEFADHLNSCLTNIEITLDKIQNCYGKDAYSWKPFGNNEEVWTVLEGVKDEINTKLIGDKFKWKRVSTDFYGDDMIKVSQSLDQIKSNFSVFVIDLFSLCDYRISTKANMIHAKFNNEKTATLVLPSLNVKHYSNLLSFAEQHATTIFQHYYSDVIKPKYANCGINICDVRDIRRFLRLSIGSNIVAPVTQISPFTKITM